MTLRNVRVDDSHCLAMGEGDLLISRNFTWSGPLAVIAAVGVARAAYDFALQWARTYTGGGTSPILYSPVVGAMLVQIASKIEAARAFCWKAAHYLDQHEAAAHGIAAMNKAYVSDSMLEVVIDCMRLVGVNAIDRRFPLERLYREAMVFPLYDAGNIGMQKRRAWGVLADPRYAVDHYVASAPFDFDRTMQGLGYVGSPTAFKGS
jgi:alkylation response protein AidB-like acyl-CoA dehydrogenase